MFFALLAVEYTKCHFAISDDVQGVPEKWPHSFLSQVLHTFQSKFLIPVSQCIFLLVWRYVVKDI